ncbi:TPA: hypothetical protein ACI7C9_004908, partial [Escherichia coli]
MGFKKSDLFLIKQGKQVTRFAHSQNPKPKGKGGASNAPLTQLQGWHSHHLTNPPGTAGGQRPEITTERDGKGLKGGLTGERLALLSFHHDKFF